MKNSKRNSSVYRGVTQRRGGTWLARGTINGVRRCLGYFDDEESAAVAALQCRQKYGPFIQEPEELLLAAVRYPNPSRPPHRRPRKVGYVLERDDT